MIFNGEWKTINDFILNDSFKKVFIKEGSQLKQIMVAKSQEELN